MLLELSTIYELTLRRIRDEATEPEESGLQIIEIVLCATKYLYLDELQHTLATEEGDNKFHAEDYYKQKEILARTGGLLTIENDQIVIFIHHTVDEYLNQQKVYHEYFNDGHLRLTRKYLAYVSFTTFKKPRKRMDQLRLHQQYPFLRYAAHRLGYHVSKCITTKSITIREATTFLEKNVPLASLQVIASKILTIPSADRMDVFLRQSSTLHLAIL